ncbi:hypothetical protein, partial [Salmonella sp. s58078]|uniref:hypothetical protein n=1 Tax=Salmonella sp. s58078 TaxID=3159699 RepID=UPI00397ECAB5
VSSFSTHKQVVDLEKEPFPEKPGGDGRAGNVKDTPNEHGCSEVLNHFQGALCTSLSSANRNSTSSTPMAPRNSCTFGECVPLGKTVQDGVGNKLNLERSDTSLEYLFQSKKSDATNQPEN